MGYVAMFLMIGLLIFVHELGHFCAAKRVGIPVKQFSIGFGPKLWSFTYNGTEYRISVFPVGGYVMPEVEELDGYFKFSLKSRLLFSFAGPLANVIFAWFGMLLICTIESGVSLRSIFILPSAGLWFATGQFLHSLPMILSDPKQLSGVVGLVAFGGKMIGTDLMRLLSLSVLLNINLAFLNLLPLLPLDGGKIVLDILHKFRLPVKRIYFPMAIAGWLLMFALMIYVTVNDVSNLMA
jgi:regulator of sigma E protease